LLQTIYSSNLTWTVVVPDRMQQRKNPNTWATPINWTCGHSLLL
jgi:hypothetical protein